MRALVILTACLFRLYPRAWRAAYAGECLSTFESSCRRVAARSRWAVVTHVCAEWVDLVKAAIGVRRGRSPVTTVRRVASPAGGRPPLMRDVRSAVRSLVATPAHTATAVLTLALGIGANAGLYSVLDSLLFRPVPFAHGDRLVEILNYSERGQVSFPGMSQALIEDWRRQTDLFDRVEGFDTDFAIFEGGQGVEVTDMALVTPGLLSMLGVPPLQGRVFSEADAVAAAPGDAVIVSERVWRSKFGARPDLVGATLTINQRLVQVVGIMPATFHFPYRSIEMWMVAGRVKLQVIARAAPGVGPEAVTAEVRARGARLQTASGGEAGVSAMASMRAGSDPRRNRMLQVLAGAVAFLLLIVCANLANLSLSRALARTREAGIRAALGASRLDLAREAIAEQLVVGVAGAAAAVLVAAAIVGLADATLPPALTLDSLNPIDLDGRVFAIIAAAGLLTPLVFGGPAVWLRARSEVASALASGSRGATSTRTAIRWRNAMVVVEVTLALVLLVGAALMGRSLVALVSIDRGFDTNGLVALRLGLPAARYADVQQRDEFSDRLVAQIRQTGQVSAVTVGHVPPNPAGSSFGRFEFAHRPGEQTEPMVVPSYRVYPDYFDQIGLRLVEGRPFAEGEPSSSAIVSESFARKYWPNGSAVGGQFRFTGATAWRTVVGVSTEVRQLQLDDEDGSFEFFAPLRTPVGATPARRPGSAIIADHRTFVARSADPEAALAMMRRLARAIDPTVVVWTAGSVDEAFTAAVAQPRLVLAVLAWLGVMGLVLAAAGIYGVLSYLVTLRLREFGIRVALGAKPTGVFRLILGYGLRLTAVGLCAGAVAAVFLVRVMQSLLYDVQPSDPIALGAVVVLLVGVAVLACWRPARRAMRVDPVSLLRD